MWLKWTCRRLRITNENGHFRIIVAFKSHNTNATIRTWACINVFGTSDSKHSAYLRRSFWYECRRVSHCTTNWWAFLLLYGGGCCSCWSHWRVHDCEREIQTIRDKFAELQCQWTEKTNEVHALTKYVQCLKTELGLIKPKAEKYERDAELFAQQ